MQKLKLKLSKMNLPSLGTYREKKETMLKETAIKRLAKISLENEELKKDKALLESKIVDQKILLISTLPKSQNRLITIKKFDNTELIFVVCASKPMSSNFYKKYADFIEALESVEENI